VIAALHLFYSWRLMFMTFHGKARACSRDVMSHVHESPQVMTIPLVCACCGRAAGGHRVQGIFVGHDEALFFRDFDTVRRENNIVDELHHVPAAGSCGRRSLMVLGFALSWLIYIRDPTCRPQAGRAASAFVYRFLLNKWYFDELYDLIFVRPAKWLGRFFWKEG
jgi:NADH-quinone oxidoreductase subunit L